MREILFRGKLKVDNGEHKKGDWVFGDLVRIKDGEKTSTMIYGFGEVDPSTVGQYTGLTDKNGKKIFEGDVIKSDNGRISAISVVLYGKFEPKLFYDLIERYVRPRPTEKLYGLFAKSTKGEEMLLSECSHLIEVIGNIHDNPKLLGGVNNGST